MARRKLGREPEIGKRWPYKALNYLPPKQLWRFLTWKSGGKLPDAPFQLGKALSNKIRLLILLPEDLQQVLTAFPVVQSLVNDLPGVDLLILAPSPMTGFLAALFGPDRVLGIDNGNFLWGEAHFQNLVRSASAFRPQLCINLRLETSPLIHFLVRSSGAPMRVQVSGEARGPFANIFLHAGEPANHLRRNLQVLRLWEFSEKPIVPKWSRLTASADNLKEAHVMLTAKGLRPESTRLFLWQGASPQRERELFQATVRERAAQGASKALAVLSGAGGLWGTPAPPQDMLLGLPAFEVESTGLLLALLSQSVRSIGTNGRLLHLAGIADADATGHFTADDAAWDTSFLNPRLRVIYDKTAE
jgi:hypothetical protein